MRHRHARHVHQHDAVPGAVAEILGLPLETVDMIHERGDLEFNGLDTVVVNWSVVGDRNPTMSREQATAILPTGSSFRLLRRCSAAAASSRMILQLS